MKPVYMSKYGLGQGDCLTACVASLLECEIADLPDFSAMDRKWLKGTREWLEANGYACIWIAKESLSSHLISDCYCIGIFTTSTEDHAVVAEWRSDTSGEEWTYELLAAHDPNRRVKVDVGELRGVLIIFPSPNTMKLDASRILQGAVNA
jgi:hypothetical protein